MYVVSIEDFQISLKYSLQNYEKVIFFVFIGNNIIEVGTIIPCI